MEASFYNDLDASWAHAWQLLVRGVNDRHHGFHTIQLATVGRDGTPQVRSVILRAVEPQSTTLRFHTDARAEKILEIEAQPTVAFHAYDVRAKLQLRLKGEAQVHADDALTEQAWAESRPMSRTCYRMEPDPGTLLDAPDAYQPGSTVDVLPGATDAGYAQFRAVVVQVTQLEWLYLAAAGHRRARWTRQGTQWSGRWLAP